MVHTVSGSPGEQVQEEQRKGLLQRPADLALVVYLILAVSFTLFRGLVSLLRSLPACPFGIEKDHRPVPSSKEVHHPV